MIQSRRRLSLRLAALATVASLGIALIACGGGGDSGSEDGQAAFPSPTASANGGTVNTSYLADLNSYKYTLIITGNGGPVASLIGTSGGSSFSVEGAYIRPDKQQVTVKVGQITSSSVIANGQLWTVVNGAVTGPVATQSNSLRLTNPLLSFWDGGPLREMIKGFDCEAATSSVNGVEARKCSVDKEAYETLSKTWGDFLGGMQFQSYTRATADVWVATNGYPVRMRLDVAGKDTNGAVFDYKLEMDLNDINGSFAINPPQ